MNIQITQTQIESMQNDFQLESSNPNYAGMYKFIYDTFGGQMEHEQSYWFQQASVGWAFCPADM